MANTWARADKAIFDDEWYLDLDDRLKLAFLHLIIYSATWHGCIPIKSVDIIASRILTSKSVLNDLIERSAGKVVMNETGLEIINYSKWNPKTSAEKQEDYRERQRLKKQADGLKNRQGVTTNVTKKVTDELPQEGNNLGNKSSNKSYHDVTTTRRNETRRNETERPGMAGLAQPAEPAERFFDSHTSAADEPYIDLAKVIDAYDAIRPKNKHLRPPDLTQKQKAQIGNYVVKYANNAGVETDEILTELANQICESEYLKSTKASWFSLHKLTDEQVFQSLLTGKYSKIFEEKEPESEPKIDPKNEVVFSMAWATGDSKNLIRIARPKTDSLGRCYRCGKDQAPVLTDSDCQCHKNL